MTQRTENTTKQVDQDSREFEANVIANNSARALFNFLRSNEENKQNGKIYPPCLFMPTESDFFDPK